MTYILMIIISVAFAIMVIQDVKHRHIHVILPIVVIVLAFVLNQDRLIWLDFIQTLVFIGVNFIGITAYFSLKRKEIINPFKAYIGLGDLLFLIAVTPMFSFRNYILFFITGMLFSLMLFLAIKHTQKYQTVPLAGFLSIYMLILIGSNLFTTTHIFYDFII